MRAPRTEPMRCPKCESRLVELERSDVMIDACPECRGVWLDRGELDRILDRERRAASGVRDDDEDFFAEMGGRRAEPRREEYREPAYDQRHHKKRRKRSMLEELFDFD